MESNIPKKATQWRFTINNYTDVDIAEFERQRVAGYYWIYGKELAPTTNTPHLQCYIHLGGVRKTRPQMSALFKRASFRTCERAPIHNINYCKEDGDFVEFGQPPAAQGDKGGEVTAEKYRLAKEQAECGKLDDISPDLYIKHYNTLKQIKNDARNRKVPGDLSWEGPLDCPNTWIYGPTGTGKSRRAREMHPMHYLKMHNKWWENYEGEDVVLIDDLGKNEISAGYLKTWGDRYGFRSEVKRDSIVLRPKHIVVTSNYHPKDLYPESSEYEPIMRRFNIIHMVELTKDTRSRKAPRLTPIVISERITRPPLYRQSANGNLTGWTPSQHELPEFFETQEDEVEWWQR